MQAYPAKVVEGRYPTTTAQASPCKITTNWIGYRRIWQGTHEAFDSVDLFLPEVSYESQVCLQEETWTYTWTWTYTLIILQYLFDFLLIWQDQYDLLTQTFLLSGCLDPRATSTEGRSRC